MKICIAQIEPKKGNISKNMEIHDHWIDRAILLSADLIVFPELSLTGYEPELAHILAMDKNDTRLDLFQKISDSGKIAIGLGAPIRSEFGIHIGMMVFQPHQARKQYSKQLLHSDELPYFIKGQDQLILNLHGKNVAPAICYESLQNEHSENAVQLGAEVYVASVAKSQKGIEKADMHYPKVARKHSIPVLMANSIGFCDNFMAVGQSAVWNEKGKLLGKLEKEGEGLLLYDTETNLVSTT